MRYYSKLIISGGLIGAVLISSCKQKIDDAYKNPNAGVRQPVELILPAMIGTMLGNSSGAANSFGLGGDIINVGRYIQYWGNYQSTITTDNGGSAFDRMAGVSGSGTNMANLWGMYYFSQGANLNRIIEWGIEEQKWDFVGAAWALRAWGMLEASNQYGEIILHQAFDAGRLQFDYDQQAEVYDSVRAICHRAIDYLNMVGGNMNPTNFGNSDFYFNKGDLGRWKKFANGVLARSYAYLHNKPTYSADSVIKYANLSCFVNSDNCTLKFLNGGTSGTKNYLGSFRGNINNSGTGIRQSAYIANLMSGANPSVFTGVADPRRWYMLRENPNGNFKGYSASYSTTINPVLIAGDSSQSFVGTAYQTTGYLSPEGGRYIFRDGAEFPIMTASEMQFLVAEASLRKGNFTDAMNAYVNGISLNFDMLSTNYTASIPVGKEITAVNKAAYLADPNIVPPVATNLTLTKIMLQKYIALFGWGAEETWTDMRRYHYKDIDPATNQQVYAGFLTPAPGVELWSGPNGTGSNNGKVVQRTRPSYNSEYLYNIPALTTIGAYPPGNDYHTKECWFSTKP